MKLLTCFYSAFIRLTEGVETQLIVIYGIYSFIAVPQNILSNHRESDCFL